MPDCRIPTRVLCLALSGPNTRLACHSVADGGGDLQTKLTVLSSTVVTYDTSWDYIGTLGERCCSIGWIGIRSISVPWRSEVRGG